MKGVKKRKYSARYGQTGYGNTTKFFGNRVLFRCPVECQSGSNITPLHSFSSQRPSVDNSATLNGLVELQNSEYFVKHKYSLYRMGVLKKHLSHPNSTSQASPFGFREQSVHTRLDASTFGNKVLINGTHYQSYNRKVKQVSNPRDTKEETYGTNLNVRQNERSCTVYSKNKKLKSELCFFYTRFGFCTDKKCRFIHDPTKVSVCRRFIRGSCVDPCCKLLHTTETDRMPVCLKFLSGLCGKNNCPYVHVNVGRNAELCKDFVFEGFCDKGMSCSKLHTWDCVEFWKTGQCSNPKKCPLRHKMCTMKKRTRLA